MSTLIIVESPTKVHTIKRYLGKEYDVVASMGHLRDLPKSKFGVDIEKDFQPQYIDIKGKEGVIKSIRSAARKSDRVFLAGDPDREGEAISWHLAHILGLDLDDKNRVTFNEITETGIKHGIENPRRIDENLVNAQQARRILDRIVGYKLSPFLWKKVRRGLSAGRVQSVAVRMIVDRENEIRSFKAEEYWTVEAKLSAPPSRRVFTAKLVSVGGSKLDDKSSLHTKEDADSILKRLEGASYVVDRVRKSVHKKTPAAPFTTSTLQQEASKRLSFQSKRTMKTAQELYEGLDIQGQGAIGLITYMRTDSLRVSDEARQAAYSFIENTYGRDYLPGTPRKYKSKAGAQDAHEAIRPTRPDITPDIVRASGVTSDQYRLYKLIWERFIASQMADCLLDTVSAEIAAADCVFKASGYSVKFDGFTALYEETKDGDEEKKQTELPPVAKGDVLKLRELGGVQHFTQPPARYTEASLVKAFEENGIGRPSTYAPTITTILQRSYVERDGKQIKPTSLGEVTTELMKEHFDNIVDVGFTAGMESRLDSVETGSEDWVEMLRDFYNGFEKELSEAENAMEGKRVKIPDEATDEICELCGKPMVIKLGKFGKFLACSGFPDCKNTRRIVTETDGVCPYCQSRILVKKTKRGKKYYGCEKNPSCQFMTWDVPTKEKCPRCASTLFQKGGKSGRLVCYKQGCGYERQLNAGNDG